MYFSSKELAWIVDFSRDRTILLLNPNHICTSVQRRDFGKGRNIFLIDRKIYSFPLLFKYSLTKSVMTTVE